MAKGFNSRGLGGMGGGMNMNMIKQAQKMQQDMMKMQQEMKLQTNAAFIIYVTAMCIPSFLIVLVIEKTKNVIHMSNKTLEWLPAIKLVTAIVFFIFAVFMLMQ